MRREELINFLITFRTQTILRRTIFELSGSMMWASLEEACNNIDSESAQIIIDFHETLQKMQNVLPNVNNAIQLLQSNVPMKQIYVPVEKLEQLLSHSDELMPLFTKSIDKICN